MTAPILNVSAELLSAIEAEQTHLQAEAEATTEEIRVQIRKLGQIIGRLESTCRRAEIRLGRVALVRLLQGAVPPVVAELRERLQATEVEAMGDEITVRQLGELKRLAADLRQQLQQACPHALVIGYDGSEGSKSMDYDDGYDSRWHCAVCDANVEPEERRGRPGDHRLVAIVTRSKLGTTRQELDALPLDDIIEDFTPKGLLGAIEAYAALAPDTGSEPSVNK